MANLQQRNQGNPGNPSDPGNMDGDGNPAAAQAAFAAGLVLPGQLLTPPVFDGERGEGVHKLARSHRKCITNLQLGSGRAKTKGGPQDY